jgi:hypothetical protein
LTLPAAIATQPQEIANLIIGRSLRLIFAATSIPLRASATYAFIAGAESSLARTVDLLPVKLTPIIRATARKIALRGCTTR